MGSGEVVTAGSHWFEPIAEHLGHAYLRYSFTKGTVNEVDALVEWLGLHAGDSVLDVGCGPGRHSHELARRGMRVHGIDISTPFVEIACEGAPDGATFERLDARSMEWSEAFDAVVCLCQGAFGLMTATGDDQAIFGAMARAVKPGGHLALSAFNAYYSVKYHAGAEFDAATGVSHEVTSVRNEVGHEREVDLWTGCYTPRELNLLAESAGLRVDHVYSVDPGAYRAAPPTVESSEFLLIASKTPFRR